ncbi:unnamed protein product [Staurois parvus]|uniref:Secreted protein n=1 Tax=Staurois parvus TaxID=386267 RepID=A0ABN9BC24_9NEOB|nr:unnamed protein product [Staurois parvus]
MMSSQNKRTTAACHFLIWRLSCSAVSVTGVGGLHTDLLQDTGQRSWCRAHLGSAHWL